MTDEHARGRGHESQDNAESPIDVGIRRVLQRQFDRRRFLALSGGALGMAMMGARGVRAQSPAAPMNLGDTLNLATWPLYHSPEVIQAFTDATGVAVNVTQYGSTEEMEAKLRAGNSGIDLVVPSNYAIEGWTADGLIEPLDYDKLPGVDLSKWDPLFVNQQFDPGNTHTIPKNWGTTGIAYRTDKLDPGPTSWVEFFQMAGSSASGKTVLTDHQISSLGSAAIAMGYDFNTLDPTELAAVEQMLIALKPQLYQITSDVQPPLQSYDAWQTIAWTGNGVTVVRDNPDTAAYIVPSDGGELWVDSWSIAADAPHRDAAYAFLDYVLQPENSALDTEFSLFPHANPVVRDLLSPEVANNPVIYPSAELLDQLTFATAEVYNSPLRAETWARVKSN